MDKPKLLDQAREIFRTRHYSPRTEETYIYWIKRYIFFHNKKHPSAMSADEVNAFLSHLATDENVSATTQNQALCAILFLYREVLRDPLPWIEDVVRARKNLHLPVVLTPAEVQQILEALKSPSRLVVQLLYGSGLRLLEALNLRVKDLNFGRHEVFIRDPKGRRDRLSTLPRTVEPELKEHLSRVQKIHENDLAHGFGRVVLPGALARKLPKAASEWPWQWVFQRHRATSTAKTEWRCVIICTSRPYNGRCATLS